ncbi:MAG: hypothetical protein RLZZ59_78, partial [Pseudomonadota bacterium]
FIILFNKCYLGFVFVLLGRSFGLVCLNLNPELLLDLVSEMSL